MTCSCTAVQILQNWQFLQSRTVLSSVLGLGDKGLAEEVGKGYTGAGEKREEEEVAERSYLEVPFPILPCCTVEGRGRGVSNESEVEPGKRGMRTMCLHFLSVSCCQNLFQLAIN